MVDRIGRLELFVEMAHLVAHRGTCSRARVGCVIVADNRVVSMGYNGAPPGQPHCEHHPDEGPNERGTVGCNIAVHAELNAICFAARAGIATEGSFIVCTHEPCRPCGQAIISAGIEHVYWTKSYHTPFSFPRHMVDQLARRV
jgi:dCMP deaminase